MERLVSINNYPVKDRLKILLKDKTTRKYIMFATTAYSEQFPDIDVKTQMTPELLAFMEKNGIFIQPRVTKSFEEQAQRTKKKAEVFTPSWICNKMNNHCDTEWFGRENVFTIEQDKTWEPTEGKIEFSQKQKWQRYVDSKRIEITCGEAPYVVSRYDTTTGEIIPIKRRIGILDRKMRIVNENTETEEEWLNWTLRAFQSVYGYEFQGDNLLIARINLLETYIDYMQDRLHRNPTDAELNVIVNTIVWNFWQMDGITGTIPFGRPKTEYKQLSFFDASQGINDTEPEAVDCKIYDWRRDNSLTYNSLKRG